MTNPNYPEGTKEAEIDAIGGTTEEEIYSGEPTFIAGLDFGLPRWDN